MMRHAGKSDCAQSETCVSPTIPVVTGDLFATPVSN